MLLKNIIMMEEKTPAKDMSNQIYILWRHNIIRHNQEHVDVVKNTNGSQIQATQEKMILA